MKSMSIRVFLFAAALVAFVLPAYSQSGLRVTGEDLLALVSGRSWAISPYGDPEKPAVTMVWDFRSDGSVCARAGASKVGDKCYDEGKWTVKQHLLCWDLTWYGEAYGYKSSCSTVWKMGPGRLELRSEKTPELPGMAVKPL